MGTHKVELLTEARLQLRDIAMYHLLQVSAASAEKITDRILDAIDNLAQFPNLGVKPPSKLVEEAGYRMLVIGEYLCFYNICDDTIYINSIVHHSVNYIKLLLKTTTI